MRPTINYLCRQFGTTDREDVRVRFAREVDRARRAGRIGGQAARLAAALPYCADDVGQIHIPVKGWPEIFLRVFGPNCLDQGRKARSWLKFVGLIVSDGPKWYLVEPNEWQLWPASGRPQGVAA